MSNDRDTESMPRRRWDDDIQTTVDRLDNRVERLWVTVYGDPGTRQVGLVERLDGIDQKLVHLIKQDDARNAQFRFAWPIVLGGISFLTAIIQAAIQHWFFP